MKRGQGALEYLIIIAAVLAIAAVVVMFLTGALGGQRGAAGLGICKATAASCKTQKETAAGVNCTSMCAESCVDPTTAMDVMNPSVAGTDACSDDPASLYKDNTGCGLCIQGKVVEIAAK